MPAACSLTRMIERLLLAPCCCFYGQQTSDWGRTANPEYIVVASAEVSDLIAGAEIISNDQLLTPKSEPDLTVDLSNCVIDVSSRCDLSLGARDTVEPAVEKLTDKFQLDLSLVAHDTVEPAIEKSQKNIVLNLICMICIICMCA